MEELIRALELKLRTAEDAAEAASAYEDMLREVNKSGSYYLADGEQFVYFSKANDSYLVQVDEDGIYDITPVAVFRKAA